MVAGGKGRAVVPIGEKLGLVLAEGPRSSYRTWVIEHGVRPVASVKTGVRAAADNYHTHWPR